MEAGQTIAGKYRLNRLLGTGGMATVWSATNVFTEREFAIKFMLPQVARTPEAARRFLLEAKVSARINHPNIIEVIDVGQAEDGVALPRDGAPHGRLARRRRPPPAAADDASRDFMGIMKDVAVALAAAHRSGVIHRDLKPTNIFLHKDRDGRVVPKILDFGVSKILEEENNTALTMVGTVLGSPLYMSPEQAMGAAGIDGRTDVFAFGGILFEALTGQRAFDAPNFNALIVTIATKQPKNIDDVAPALPEPLRALVRDCMVTDKTKRLASVDLVAERLTAMLPELEKAAQHLPSQYGVERSSDPDATNALPVVRKSDRPPRRRPRRCPRGHPSPLAMQISKPAAPEEAGRAGEGVAARGREVRRRDVARGSWRSRRAARGPSSCSSSSGSRRRSRAAAARALGPRRPARRAADGGDGAGRGGGHGRRPRRRTSRAPTTRATCRRSRSTRCPCAARAPAKGNGRLSVVASPGWCSISVDGQQRGVTPLNAFELPAGRHRVDCVPPNGRREDVDGERGRGDGDALQVRAG